MTTQTAGTLEVTRVIAADSEVVFDAWTQPEHIKQCDLTREIAILAGELGIRYKLPLADSVILATARSFNAILWTQDSDFEGLENVEYIPRC